MMAGSTHSLQSSQTKVQGDAHNLLKDLIVFHFMVNNIGNH